ncbi:MAG TPA: dihydropteroate synthase [Candidatus Saccharimonadales bacterium]|nr:dihydropteroate synthase [Candidatus Saccharimonadales bacterium]
MVKLVGILNITPDSFSDGGKFVDPAAALAQAEQLFKDGASLVDVGAESTRPGATPLTADEEWARLEPVLGELVRRYPGKISLDTYHPETAERALALGDVIINDVTGMNNPAMVDVVARHRARCIVSHLPSTDVQAAHYQQLIDDIEIVKNDLLAKLALLGDRGLPPENIILDPGIGFGKTSGLNGALLSFARLVPGHDVMVGYSRKRFLGEDRMLLGPNLKAGRTAIASGAAYIRVHDVAGHNQLLLS